MKLLCAQFARCPGLPCVQWTQRCTDPNRPWRCSYPIAHWPSPAACPGASALSYLFCGCRTEGQMDREPERCMLHVGHVSHILPSWTHAGILLCTGLRRQLLPLLLLLEMMPCGSMSSCRCRSSFRAGAGAGAGSASGSGSCSCAMFAQRNTLQIVRKGAIEMQFKNAPKNARQVLENCEISENTHSAARSQFQLTLHPIYPSSASLPSHA